MSQLPDEYQKHLKVYYNITSLGFTIKQCTSSIYLYEILLV